MTNGHPLRVREWVRRVEGRRERAPRGSTAGLTVFLVSAMVGLALAMLAAVLSVGPRP